MPTSLYDIALTRIDGTLAHLADYRGKVLLVVNVASKCGLTPQYEGLQKLYADKRAKGLEILGFPANNFGAQEPGTEAEISAFCSTNYGVAFPMFQKISVVGEDRHPLYDALVAAYPRAEGAETMRARLSGYGVKPASDTDVLWNFEKFVIGRDGRVIARFSPDVTADDPRLAKVLDEALAD
ncbi:glutathione peroxidase [Xanthobacter autotrophicus]|uniref:glutathione peroxidase n=1 Tax=Xanthobacter autotrophicus TaxID=280 RepID=UPI003727F4B9